MFISKFIGYVLIHLLNLGVPSALSSKTFKWYSTSIDIICKSPSIGTSKVNKKPLKVCKVLISNKWYHCQLLRTFRATSVHDMI